MQKKRWPLFLVVVVLLTCISILLFWKMPRRGASFLALPIEQATHADIWLSNVQGYQTYSIDGEILTKYLDLLDLENLSLQYCGRDGIGAEGRDYVYGIYLDRRVDTEPYVLISRWVFNEDGEVLIDGTSLYRIRHNQDKITDILISLRKELQESFVPSQSGWD